MLNKTLDELQQRLRHDFVRIHAASTADLCPGIKDADLDTVERIRLVVNYLQLQVDPLLRDHPNINVMVEYQMGPNAHARIVADAIITYYIHYTPIIVPPALKNRIFLCEEGKYQNFISTYSTTYQANKKHAIANFNHLLKTVYSDVPPDPYGHVADSCLQVLGWLKFKG
jgi:hypothetical protein